LKEFKTLLRNFNELSGILRNSQEIDIRELKEFQGISRIFKEF
jgi:hypothetical protein